MTYWVTNDLISGDWKELPVVTPTQLKISRRIKFIFSGDINKDIFTNPFFPGKEGHLLKCQIVRITFGCTIVPRTMFNVNP
jgi:radial spoke head protein 4A